MSARPICRRCGAIRALGEDHRLLELPTKPGRVARLILCKGR